MVRSHKQISWVAGPFLVMVKILWHEGSSVSMDRSGADKRDYRHCHDGMSGSMFCMQHLSAMDLMGWVLW